MGVVDIVILFSVLLSPIFSLNGRGDFKITARNILEQIKCGDWRDNILFLRSSRYWDRVASNV